MNRLSNMGVMLFSPRDVSTRVGNRARERRLASGLRQSDLAARAGVTLSTLRRFEAGGNVGFDAVVRVALALGAEREVADLFAPIETRSLDQILESQKKRYRARRHS